MDTKSSVVWVTGNSTKFSKTVAGGGPVYSEPNPAPSGQDLWSVTWPASALPGPVCASTGSFRFSRPEAWEPDRPWGIPTGSAHSRLGPAPSVHQGVAFRLPLPLMSGILTSVPSPWPANSSVALGTRAQPRSPKPCRVRPEVR